MTTLCWIGSSYLGSYWHESAPSFDRWHTRVWIRRCLNIIDFFRNFTVSSSKFLRRVALFFKTIWIPIFEFHMEQDTMYTYWMILNLHYTCVVCDFERYTKPQNSDCFQWPQSGCFSPLKPHHPCRQSVVEKNYFLHVKFEVRFVISYVWENPCPTKKVPFSRRMVHSFFLKKMPFEKFGSFLVFWTGGYQGHMVFM
jgi:hypothetical protein